MTVRIVHKNSNQPGRNPTANQLANGELAINYNEDGPFLSVRDTGGRIVRVGGVWLDDGAPANPAHGALWVDTDNNNLFIWDEDNNLWRQLSGIGGGGGGGGAVNRVDGDDGVNVAPNTGNVRVSASINNDTNVGGGGLEFDGGGRIQINAGNGLDINGAGELVSTVGALTFIGLVDATQTVAAEGLDGLGAGDAGNTWVNTAGPNAIADGSWGFPNGTTVDAGDMVIWNGTDFVLVPTGGGVGATDLTIEDRNNTGISIRSSTAIGADARIPLGTEDEAGSYLEPDNTVNNTTEDFVRRSVRDGDGNQEWSWETAPAPGGNGTVTSITPGVGLRQATDANDTGGDNDNAITAAGFIGLTDTAVDTTAGIGGTAQFGNGTNVAQFTVDAQGRITQAANVAITATGLNQVNAGDGITVSGIAANEQTISARTGTGLINNGGAGTNEITLQAATDATIGGITEPGAAGDFIRRRTGAGVFSWEVAPNAGAGFWQRDASILRPTTDGDNINIRTAAEGNAVNIALNADGTSDFNGNMVIGAAPGTAGNSGVEFRPSGRFHSRVNDVDGASVGINNGNIAFWIGQNDALAAGARTFEINRFGRSRQDVRVVSAAGAWDLEQGNLWQTDNTAGSDTIQNPGNATAGMSGLIFTRQAITTWGNNFDFPGGAAPANVPANSVVPFYVVADNQILIGNATENVS